MPADRILAGVDLQQVGLAVNNEQRGLRQKSGDLLQQVLLRFHRSPTMFRRIHQIEYE